MSELGSGQTPNKSNQDQNSNCKSRRPVKSEQPSVSSAQEIDKRVLFDCESTNVRTGRLVNSCVPVSAERLDQDKDADENVDADQISTSRPLKSETIIGLFTQLEEIDIDFRVSGLPHAVVKQAENFCVRELVKKIEKSSSSTSSSSRFATKITPATHSVTNRKR